VNGQVTTGLPWGFRARLTKGHDGDSFWMLCDVGFGARVEPELRLLDVHAPELMQPGGQETTDYVNGWLAGHLDPVRQWPFWVEIVQTRTFEPGMKMTFTRYLATVWKYEDGAQKDTRVWASSLNASVTFFLSEHPDWPSGE
jgi:hypothetical protein